MKGSKQVFWIIVGLFAFIALVLVIVSLSFWKMEEKMMSAGIRVDGEYVRVGRDGVEITYEAEGEEWTMESSVYSGSMQVGDEVDVWYLPDQPGTARASVPVVWQTLILVGGLFGLIGGVFLVVLLRKALRRRSLELNGIRVTAQVTEVERNYAVRINGRNPYVIRAVCRHPYTGQEMQVKSGFLMKDPSERLSGGQIDVLVDPMKENRYHMLVEELG